MANDRREIATVDDYAGLRAAREKPRTTSCRSGPMSA